MKRNFVSIPHVDAWIKSCVKLRILKEYKYVEEWVPFELEVPGCGAGVEEQIFREM